jgi:hypothetical protein
MRTARTLIRPAPYLVLAMALAISACSVDAQVTAEGEFERRLRVDGPVDLTVQTGSGSIEVRRGSGSEVHVVGRIRSQAGFWRNGNPAENIRTIVANPPVRQNGNEIRLGEIADRELTRNISISYEIVVPETTRLRSRTGSGSHRVDSISGPVDAETGSGSIRLGDIASEVRVSTGSGSIEVLGARSGLTAETGSGSIRATGVNGGLRASTGSGSVTIDGTPGADWAIETGSGGVTVRLPGDVGFELNATSGSGAVETDHPIEVRGSISRNRIQGRVRGGGPRLSVSTGSGSIRLQ